MNPKISIRSYEPHDKNDVLHLIRLNTPKYFAHEEEKDFDHFLDTDIDLYFVLLVDDKIVGAGGINFSEDKTKSSLSWDIFHPNYQGQKLGSQLLQYRLDHIKSLPEIQKIYVDTSQLVYKFYEKHEFVLYETRKNYWAKGIDLYRMKIEF